MSKIKRELKQFRKFYYNYDFSKASLVDKDGTLYFGDEVVQDADGKVHGEGEHFINVGYNSKVSLAKILSNLFPYEFTFRGRKVQSIEGVLQGIKFPNKKMQNLVLDYSRTDACHIKYASDYDWRKTGILYWQGEPMDRFSAFYEDFLLELFVSAIQNPLYRQALLNVDRLLIHSIGKEDNEETVLTRYEFEKMLNALVQYLKMLKKIKKKCNFLD